MRMMVSFRGARWVAWAMTSLFALPYLGSGALAATSEDIFAQTAVLFPLDNVVEDQENALKAGKAAEELSEFLRQGLTSYPKYLVMVYSEHLPSVQRLVAVQPDKKDEASGPFSGDPSAIGKAASIARSMSADLAISGSLDFYKFDTEKAEAEITATVQIVDAKTAKIVGTVTAAGRAARTAGTDRITESKIVSRAVAEAGRKIMTEITGEQYDGTKVFKVEPTTKKSHKRSWLPLLLLSLGIGLLLGNSGGGDGGGGSTSGPEAPPPPPSL